MSGERVGGRDEAAVNSVLADSGDQETSPALRLQILTTEHWSLLVDPLTVLERSVQPGVDVPVGPVGSGGGAGARCPSHGIR